MTTQTRPTAASPVPSTSSTCSSRGEHGNPHAVLGPHPHDGGVTVRVSSRSPHASPSVHGDGGVAPSWATSTRASGSASLPVADVPDYRVAVDLRRRRDRTPRRPLPLPAHARRDRPPPDQRGPPRAAVDGARRPGAPLRAPAATVTGTSSRSGRRARAASGSRATSTAGTAASTRCASSAPPACGSCSCPASAAARLQVPSSSAPTASGARRPTRWRPTPRCRRPRRPWSSSRATTWGDDAWMAARAGEAARRTSRCRVYEMHLGSWRHAAATYATSSPTSWSPYVADLGFTHVELMPVMQHPFGGSWGYHVTSYFAPDSRFGDPDGFRLPRRPAAPGRHRRDPGLGARPLRRPTSGRWPASTAPRSTRTPTPSAAGTRSGAPTSSTSAATRCATSSTPTRSTGSRSSTPTGCASTASPRCSTSTTPARRASGRPTSTAAARTSRRCSSSRR